MITVTVAIKEKPKKKTFQQLSEKCPWHVGIFCNGQYNNGYRVQCLESNCSEYYWYKQGK